MTETKHETKFPRGQGGSSRRRTRTGKAMDSYIKRVDSVQKVTTSTSLVKFIKIVSPPENYNELPGYFHGCYFLYTMALSFYGSFRLLLREV